MQRIDFLIAVARRGFVVLAIFDIYDFQIRHVARHVDIKCILRAEILLIADSHTQRIVIVFMQDFMRTQYNIHLSEKRFRLDAVL